MHSKLRARLEALPGLAPLLQEFFLESPVAFQLYSLDGYSLGVNQAFLNLFGSEPPPEYCVFEDSIAMEKGYVVAMREAFEGKGARVLPTVWYSPSALTNIQNANTRWIAMESQVFAIRGADGKVAYGAFAFKDVTREETYLRELKETQFLLEKAQQLAGLGSFSVDMDEARRVRWSKYEYEIYGMAEGTFSGTVGAFLSMVHPEDRSRVQVTFERLLSDQDPIETEFRIYTPSGELKWLSERVELLPATEGRPPRILGVTRDVSEEKFTAEKVRFIEGRFRSLFESSFFGCFLALADGSILDANDAFLEMTGYDRDDLRAGRMSWSALTPPEFAEVDLHALAQLEVGTKSSGFQKEYIRKDGTRIPVLVGGSWIGPEKVEIIAYAHDLSDQKRLEQQFHQSQRLESIGRLAGGVAHDFNNILGIILLYLEEMKSDTLDSLQRKDHLESITKHVKRAIRLTKQLLAFGRRQPRAPRSIRVNAVVNDLREMIGRSVSENIELRFELGENLPSVCADLSQLEQVILNLITNARDAILDTGSIKIRTEAVHLSFQDLNRLRLAVGRPGPFVRLSVTDTGSGIDPKVLPHLYEPFFTTKDVGKGTGLGLATVYGIARESKGDVRVDTELGKGSTFEVYFPAEAEEVAAKPGPGAGTLLIVEDQEDLRRLMRDFLAEKGFRVLEARTGKEALQLCKNWPEPIHLLICDVILPEMSGPAFVKELGKLRKGIPVLYTSGYSEDELVRNGVNRRGLNFLQKPFTKARLVARVQSFFQG